jgi:hypothetical protein
VSVDPEVMPTEDLLQALATGDLGADDPRVVRRLATDDALRDQWRRMQTTIEHLRDVGADHRDAIGEAHPRRTAPPTLMPPVTRRGRWPIGVAAAAIAIVIASWAMRGESENPPDPSLGGGAGSSSPDGTTWREDEPLRWSAVRGAAAYRLEVEDETGARVTVPGPGFDVVRLTNSEWPPTAAERTRLPRRFRWRVVALNASGNPLAASGWAKTWQ